MKASKVKKYEGGGLVSAIAGSANPAAAIGGIAQTALGLIQTGAGIYQLGRANKALNRILADAPKIETPSAYYKLAKDAYDEDLMQLRLADINRDMATSVSALQQAGGRALVGGLTQSVDAAQRQKAMAMAEQNQRQLAAQTMLAQREDVTQQQREQRFRMQLGAAQQAKAAAQQNIYGGLGSTATGAMIAGASMGDVNFGGGSNASATQSTAAAPTMAQIGQQQSQNFAGTGVATAGAPIIQPNIFQPAPSFIQQPQQQNVYQAIGNLVSQPGSLTFEKGGKVVKTKGKFDHKSNPIDMVQNGEKVGEMTGGEYVFNPKQMASIKSMVAGGDKEKLHKYIKTLIKKFENE